MEPEDRTAGAGLIQTLAKDARWYSFFQLVQLLQRTDPQAPRLGHQGPAGMELVRFRPMLSLGFPSSDVMSMEVTEDPSTGRPRCVVETTFLALYGTVSPLPNYFTEDLLHETSEESLVREFMDLFHHRLVSLFYRCWEKYRYYIQFRTRGADVYSRRVLCMMGLGIAAPAEGSAVPLVRLLRYAGLLSRKPASAAGLECILRDYFEELQSRVTCCTPRWVNIPVDSRNVLGAANCSLGVDLSAGEQVMDRSGGYRMSLGPMGLMPFVGFLPGGGGFAAVDEIARLLSPDRLQYELELILTRGEIPEMRLTTDSLGTRLGQTTWLGRPGDDAHVFLQEPRLGGAAPAVLGMAGQLS